MAQIPNPLNVVTNPVGAVLDPIGTVLGGGQPPPPQSGDID